MQRDIKCPNCGALFGKEVATTQEPEDKILSIKNRDLYRSYRGGTVWGPCRGCGTTVKWPESK